MTRESKIWGTSRGGQGKRAENGVFRKKVMCSSGNQARVKFGPEKGSCKKEVKLDWKGPLGASL